MCVHHHHEDAGDCHKDVSDGHHCLVSWDSKSHGGGGVGTQSDGEHEDEESPSCRLQTCTYTDEITNQSARVINSNKDAQMAHDTNLWCVKQPCLYMFFALISVIEKSESLTVFPSHMQRINRSRSTFITQTIRNTDTSVYQSHLYSAYN